MDGYNSNDEFEDDVIIEYLNEIYDDLSNINNEYGYHKKTILFLNANLIELNPMQTPTKVKIFGSITLEFLLETNLIFLFGCSIKLSFCNQSFTCDCLLINSN